MVPVLEWRNKLAGSARVDSTQVSAKAEAGAHSQRWAPPLSPMRGDEPILAVGAVRGKQAGGVGPADHHLVGLKPEGGFGKGCIGSPTRFRAKGGGAALVGSGRWGSSDPCTSGARFP
jgi:hypothetical protein